jgi:hypothetical protein
VADRSSTSVSSHGLPLIAYPPPFHVDFERANIAVNTNAREGLSFAGSPADLKNHIRDRPIEAGARTGSPVACISATASAIRRWMPSIAAGWLWRFGRRLSDFHY